MEGGNEHIVLANPDGYQTDSDQINFVEFKDQGVVIVQKGFNQTPREEWNKIYGQNVANDLNVEYFEVVDPKN